MISPAQIGSYRVERLLGTGSFATVWLGYDASLGARVAIKVLAENWSHDLRVRERFLDEARLLWRLDHHRVVRVYSLGELTDGRPYLVMAWADGGSLRDRLAAGPVPVPAALRLLREIAAGVAVLHDNGVVHRDLTPGNVLFRSGPVGPGPAPASEQVVIADLGLAKALAAASGLTARAGTPGYMAPEQDDPMAVVDTRTDVYGLGRLGSKLLSTFDAGRFDDGIQPRGGVPDGVVDVLRIATAHLPADRYPDAAAFLAALDRAIAGMAPPRAAGRRPGAAVRPGTAAPPAAVKSPVWTANRPPRRRHRLLAAVVVLAWAAAVLTVPSDTVLDCRRNGPSVATDPTGRVAVALPKGWCGKGTEWDGRRDFDGGFEPALVVSPDPDRWKSDASVPGAFVGLSRSLSARTTPAAYVAERRPATCTAVPVRITRQAGIDWVVARYTACSSGKAVIVEAAGTGPAGAGLVYVQLAPPAGSAPEFVDTLLAGVRVR